MAGFESVPERSEFIDNRLLAMDAFRTEDGWDWRMPKDEEKSKRYISEILEALDNLCEIPVPDTSYQADIDPTYETLWNEGWDDITDEKIEAIQQKILSFSGDFDEASQKDLVILNSKINELRELAKQVKKPEKFYLAHNDARQSNITWHSEKGVKIIDWSWADPMPENTDTTMFLIDLVKSGHDVSPYMEKYFNKDHALTLIGFWLNHSLWSTHDGSTTIRMQQVASALAAFKIINSMH